MYRGRLAPSPTGFLHLGHARTFHTAWKRARAAGGCLLLRIDDLDGPRCRREFETAALEDLRWCGLDWDGPPIRQSTRLPLYRAALESLLRAGHLYPCKCSRKEIAASLSAPHEPGRESVYPGTCRPPIPTRLAPRNPPKELRLQGDREADHPDPPAGVNWRFRVCDGEVVRVPDLARGTVEFVAGRDFGDFPVWRRDHLPSYHLATTVDDATLEITEVVRGEDLMLSAARQILLARALGLAAPQFYHCPLVLDAAGQRLAKRDGALALRALRAAGQMPEFP